VYRLHGKANVAELFLKHGKKVIADDITDEMVRLRWLAKYAPVPAVVHFTRTDNEAWLLMTAISGKTAHHILKTGSESPTAVVDAIAEFLKQIHAIPTYECPFTSEQTYRLSCARTRIDAGLVDEDDFDDERKGWTAEQVWKTLQSMSPFVPDTVVTHGDFSLDNLLIREGKVLGCIDVGRVGIADRYQDLAIAWNGLAEFGASLQQRFLEQYGTVDIDWNKLQFHLMLDELF
jgi:aminoglycoside 3'-phosphotransferase-1